MYNKACVCVQMREMQSDSVNIQQLDVQLWGSRRYSGE